MPVHGLLPAYGEERIIDIIKNRRILIQRGSNGKNRFLLLGEETGVHGVLHHLCHITGAVRLAVGEGIGHRCREGCLPDDEMFLPCRDVICRGGGCLPAACAEGIQLRDQVCTGKRPCPAGQEKRVRMDKNRHPTEEQQRKKGESCSPERE